VPERFVARTALHPKGNAIKALFLQVLFNGFSVIDAHIQVHSC
jgi:hypothetical protein